MFYGRQDGHCFYLVGWPSDAVAPISGEVSDVNVERSWFPNLPVCPTRFN